MDMLAHKMVLAEVPNIKILILAHLEVAGVALRVFLICFLVVDMAQHLREDQRKEKIYICKSKFLKKIWAKRKHTSLRHLINAQIALALVRRAGNLKNAKHVMDKGECVNLCGHHSAYLPKSLRVKNVMVTAWSRIQNAIHAMALAEKKLCVNLSFIFRMILKTDI